MLQVPNSSLLKEAMQKAHLIFIIYIIFSFSPVVSQDSAQDSLITEIENAQDDKSKVDAIIELANTYRGVDYDEQIRLAEEAKRVCESIGYEEGLAEAYKCLGIAYSDQQIYVEATLNYNESLRLFEDLGDKRGAASILNNLGAIYNYQDDDEKALELYLRSLGIGKEIGDKTRILTASLNIGLIYQKKEATWDRALEYYFIALPLAEELNYSDGIGTTCVNIGEVYLKMGKDSLALQYFQKSREALEGSRFLPYALMFLGKYHTNAGEFEEAIQFHQEAFQLAEDQNDKYTMSESLIGMAQTHIAQGKIQDALSDLKKAEMLADDIGSKEKLRDAYDLLASQFASLENFENAYQYQKKLTDIKDSLFRSANEKRLNLMLTTFNLEQKEKEVQVQELTIQKQRLAKNAFLIGLLFILVIAFIIFRNYRAKVRINKILDKQKEQIETLLLNILPKKVAAELQEKGAATPRDYESVSVLFTDFKGFSSISKTLNPNELVNELSAFFVAFDNITEKYGLEKIKTIGDAYMAAGGIPTPNTTHPLDTVLAGLEMQKFMRENNKKREAEGKIPWELRVGIHTGPIVAGVVGKKKYAYDIWGSTVNIASRMESNGEAGKVNVSQSTYCLLNDNFKFEHRGKIYARNVGDIDMYFVE